MGKRSVSIAWKVYLAYGIYMVVLGFLMLVMPREFAKGEFESFTGAVWAEFTEANAKTGSFVELVYRALGCMVLLIGILKVFIASYPYRKAEAWSWWTALTVGVIAWGFMLPFSVIIGAKDMLVFNIIGFVLFLVAIVLPAKTMLARKS